jgi:hypothetical protein
MSGVVSVGAAVGAATMAATATTTMGMVMGVVGAVGAAASAVGYFTKSKELQIGGAALGLVGGIGGMAAGAGMFGAASGAAAGAEGAMGGVSAVAGPAGGYTATLGAEGLGTTMGAAGGFSGSSFVGGAGAFGDLMSKGITTDVLSSITGGAPPSDTLLKTPVASPSGPVDQFGQTIAQGGGEGGTLGVTGNPSATQPPGLIDTPAAVTPDQTPTTPMPDYSGNPPISTGPYQSTMPAGTDIPIVTAQPGATQPVTAMPTASGDASPWAGILQFMKENQTLIAAGGSFLKGAFNPKTDAEVNALSAVGARNTAEANMINRRMDNMSQPIPVAQRRKRTNTGTGRIDRVPA